ncbi:NACHT domain-containing protein [Streptomyces sp. 4N509B]|uniref:NACHT domain-containing protein n=1 Tax=Streptomyces sp. 4N509B TaxID=3457413 RepID=UPI003FD470D9
MRSEQPSTPNASVERLPELEPIAAYFSQAIDEVCGSIPLAAEMTGLDRRAIFELVNAVRMLPLPTVLALGEGLRRDPEEVRRLWAEAKRACDRAEEEARRRESELPHVETWADIPSPSPAVRDLLRAQERVLDCLPYRLLDLEEPPLSAVYVRQSVRRRPTADGSDPADGTPDRPDRPGGQAGDRGAGPDGSPRSGADAVPGASSARSAAPDGGTSASASSASSNDAVMSLADALARHDHLLITGEAGAGKSTLASHLVRSLCRVWLARMLVSEAPIAEPVVPLRVSASLLASESGSWSERLCRATLRTLGGHLVTPPPPSLFNGRSQGARWLVFVDGLDEVTDRRLRADLIRTVTGHCHRDSDFRVVVMSRPLPPTELAPLRTGALGHFEIQPFGRSELGDYARRWFAQQRARVPNPAAAANRFVEEVVEENELAEVVSNPLLATMALVNATLEPSQPPAASRLRLYETFLDHLRERTATPGGRAGVPDWLTDSVDELLRALARLRTEGEEELLGAARDWVRHHRGQGRVPPAGWESELAAALAGTGLMVVAGEQVRFLHQSFAEFLAAEEYAKEIAADGDGLETWFRRACHGTGQTLALFVLCRWARREDCSADAIIDRLLSSIDEERTLLAAVLMAEGIEVAPERATRVTRLLVALFRSDDTEDTENAARALSSLGARYQTAPILTELAQAPELRITQRYLALTELNKLASPDVVTSLLLPQLELLAGWLDRAAHLARHLGPAAQQAVRRRIVDYVRSPGARIWDRANAAEAYAALGAHDDAARLARSVLEDPLAAASLQRSAEVWLESAPAESTEEAIRQVAALGHARPAADHTGRLAIATALEAAGAWREAADLARRVLEWEHPLTGHEVNAAELWLRAQREEATEPVRRLLERGREAGWEVWRQAWLMRVMVEAGIDCQAAEWLQRCLSGGFELPLASDILRLWSVVHGSAGAARLHELLGDGFRLHPFDRSKYARALLDGGLVEEAFRVAELALRPTMARDSDCKVAAAVMIECDRERAVAALLSHLHQPWATDSWGSGVLDAIADDRMPDLDELALRVAEHVVSRPNSESAQVRWAYGPVAVLSDRADMERLAARFCEHPELALNDKRVLADSLAASGEEQAARVVWRHLLSVPGREWESTVVSVVEDMARALGYEATAELVRELLAGDPPPAPFHQARLERMLTWLAASPRRS